MHQPILSSLMFALSKTSCLPPLAVSFVWRGQGIRYTSFGGSFPTVFHRIYAFDQATYYLQVRLRSLL